MLIYAAVVKNQMMLASIDRVFIVIFARYLRKMGAAKLQSAWVIANDIISASSFFPCVGLMLVIVSIIVLRQRAYTL
jgi:hypothetical protein